MARIGEVLTQSDLTSLRKWSEATAERRGYVAPTVYKLATSPITALNYYRTIDDAIFKLKYLQKKPGGKNVSPAGSVKLQNTRTAQTIGINVDFYLPDNNLGPIAQPYTAVKQKFAAAGNVYMPFKFYKTDGSGPFFAILASSDMGIAATVTAKLSPEKIEAFDKLTREITLLRINYNALASFLNDLSKKKLNKTQQQIFNEGILRLQEYREDIRSIKDVDFVFGKNNQVSGIGILPVVAWLIFGIASALIAAWAVTKIAAKWSEVAKIRSDNDTVTFLTDAKIRIAENPNISAQDKTKLLADIDKSITKVEDHKNTVEENAAKPDTIQQLISLAKWGLIFYGVKIIGETVSKKISK